MIRMVAGRLALSIPLVLIVTAVVFVLMNALPGNAASAILGTNATPEAIESLTRELGLDQPVWAQYWTWLSGVLQGDLGVSIFNNEPVTDLVNARFGVTLLLLVGALGVAIVAGVSVGVLTARRQGWVSRVIDVLAIAGFAVPAFWLALLLIYLFAVQLALLPATGYVPFLDDPLEWYYSLVLPVLALAAGMITSLAKQTRDSMLEVLASPYVTALRANGIRERSVVFKHALRNAAIPIVTVVGVLFVGSLTGAVVIESIFVLPGLGTTVVTATAQRDIPVILGAALYLTLLVVAINILTDLAYGWLNPKVRAR
ncbi:ABC transporter permease [Pseudonocardia sp. RS11V-5]|uniref:ABC transporter permease n=1 Tax=Pseudonocardia terrae TaxID=2905831 RepID=UPI001E33B7B5|nr:ABC transporter permease [Pseudonocardia terrae]MCE3555911.1 ABC transporter permease [Pseudonocardia terrae]